MVWSLDLLTRGEVDSLLNFLPVTFSHVVDRDEQLGHFDISPLEVCTVGLFLQLLVELLHLVQDVVHHIAQAVEDVEVRELLLPD